SEILAYHEGGAERFLLDSADDSPLQARLTGLGSLLCFASFSLRQADGSLCGALVVADARAREWDQDALDALSELGSLVATARDRESCSMEASLLENTLSVQAAYLDHLFNASPEGIAVLDGENRITRINPQYTRIYGYTPE